MWKNNVCINTITGHTDVVRDLCIVDDIGFASCSNDGYVYTHRYICSYILIHTHTHTNMHLYKYTYKHTYVYISADN